MLTQDKRLTIEWIDPRGKVWNLTDGTEGVILDVKQSDLTLPTAEHHYVRGGTQWAGTTIGRAEPSLKVIVGDTLTSTTYYALADEWWTQANSFTDEGTLRITRPDGSSRELRARLRDTPGTEYLYDPGAGITDAPGEPWLLTSPSSYYVGPEQTVAFDADAIGGGGGTPFFGPDGTGWPLHISATNTATNVFVTNGGQGAVWLTWTLNGPLTNPRFGTTGGELTYQGTVAEGEQIIVTTEPGERYAVETSAGDSRYGNVTGVYAPLPVGDRVPLSIAAEGMTDASLITVTVREQFARPF